MKLSALFLALALSDGARVSVHDHEEAAWGRSCSSLQTRFTNQGSRLSELEGTRQLMASIGVMRTLRRANARQCDWITSGDVDVGAVMQVAGSSLQSAPCYEEARAAAQAAHSLPEAERDAALDRAAVMMLSTTEGGCAQVPEPGDLTDSEDAMEEEMDDTTDEVMESMAPADGVPAFVELQQGTPGLALVGWWVAGLCGILCIIGSILVGIVMGLLCRYLVHLIIRIFRFIRCRIFGRSCTEYEPATWLRSLVSAGCHIGGMMYGPFGLAYTAAGVNVAGQAIGSGVQAVGRAISSIR